MQNAFIIHGTGGHSNENWFPRMKKQLEELNISTTVPDFGNESKPDIQKWNDIFDGYTNKINEETIFIGHSLGGAFLLKFLERYKGKIHLIVTVGSPVGERPIKFYEGDADFLDGFNFDWEKIKNKFNNSIIIHSDNDPYVSLGNGKMLSKKLETDLLFIPQAGHFNEDSGYVEFPRLLEEIKNYI